MTAATNAPMWKFYFEAAWFAESKGEYDLAESQYSLSLSLAELARGPVHEEVGEALLNLADFYVFTHRYEESVAIYERALLVYEELFGRNNLVTYMICRILAQISLLEYRRQGVG